MYSVFTIVNGTKMWIYKIDKLIWQSYFNIVNRHYIGNKVIFERNSRAWCRFKGNLWYTPLPLSVLRAENLSSLPTIICISVFVYPSDLVKSEVIECKLHILVPEGRIGDETFDNLWNNIFFITINYPNITTVLFNAISKEYNLY